MILTPETDLELLLTLKAPPEKVWRCWTEPALLARWFAPKPVVTRDVRIDLRPGGLFATTMDIPDHDTQTGGTQTGGTQTGEGCFLEIVPHRRLVWTDLLGPAYRPVTTAFGFTAIIELSPDGSGTRYRALALHRTPEQCKSHADMGFHNGWGTAAAQLDAVAVTL